MLNLKPSQQQSIVVHTFDGSNQEDIHDLKFETSNTSVFDVVKTGPNTAKLYARETQATANLIVKDEANAIILTEPVKVDDTTIARATIELVP